MKPALPSSLWLQLANVAYGPVGLVEGFVVLGLLQVYVAYCVEFTGNVCKGFGDVMLSPGRASPGVR